MLKTTAVILFCSSLARGARRGTAVLLLLALVAGPLQAQTNCPLADYALFTQADVDAFPTGCDTVTGIIKIGPSTDIMNLDGLSGLTEVGGYLAIESNPMLTDCSGVFPLLTTGTISGSTFISDNTSWCSSENEPLPLRDACGQLHPPHAAGEIMHP